MAAYLEQFISAQGIGGPGIGITHWSQKQLFLKALATVLQSSYFVLPIAGRLTESLGNQPELGHKQPREQSHPLQMRNLIHAQAASEELTTKA